MYIEKNILILKIKSLKNRTLNVDWMIEAKNYFKNISIEIEI